MNRKNRSKDSSNCVTKLLNVRVYYYISIIKLWFPRKAVPLYYASNVTVDDVTKTVSDQILL